MDRESYPERQMRIRTEIKAIQDIILKTGYCTSCGLFTDPRIIELHHISGKKNSDTVMPVCPNCHKIFSMKQRGWDSRWMDADNSDPLKLAFHLRGISDLMALYSRLSKEWSDKILKGELP